VEAANLQTASTGPWEIVDHRTGEFWRMQAVEDHWRKTPHFAEMVFWEIPEESATPSTAKALGVVRLHNGSTGAIRP
jgi:ABC-type transport system substrate-binding protein